MAIDSKFLANDSKFLAKLAERPAWLLLLGKDLRATLGLGFHVSAHPPSNSDVSLRRAEHRGSPLRVQGARDGDGELPPVAGGVPERAVPKEAGRHTCYHTQINPGGSMFEDHFKYHPPTDVTAPLYSAIREAESNIQAVINSLQTSGLEGVADFSATSPLYYEQVNSACLRMANLHVVPSDHPAFVALQLCRSAANEAIATRKDVGRLLAIARSKAQEARWLMCGHVAISHAQMEKKHKMSRSTSS